MVCALATPLLAHFVLRAGQPSPVGWLLIVLQLGLAGGFVALRVAPPYRLPALGALAALGLTSCLIGAHGGLVLSSGLLHALAYGSLLMLFGASLLPAREPVAMFCARAIHGPLAEDVQRYTRGVTQAWCVFFVLQLSLSLLLLCFASVGTWSLFVNVLNAPLVLLMFIAERLFRSLWVVNPPREQVANVMELIRLMKSGALTRDRGIR